MKISSLNSFVLLAAAASTSTSASSSSPQPQIYLNPSPPSHSQSILSLTAPQANAVLAHHLGVSQYERLPAGSAAPGMKEWEDALSSKHLGEGEGPKMIILLECPKQGCKDLIPDSFVNSKPYNLPNLPLQSWTSVVTLHLHRLVSSLGLNPDQVKGLDQFVTAIKSVEGWMGWVGEELGAAIGWDKLKQNFKAAVESEMPTSAILTELDFASTDASAKNFVMELESLSTLTDSFVSSSTDNGPQSSTPEVVAIHLKGMKDIASTHRPGSAAYERAALLARQTLTATIAAFHHSCSTATSTTTPRIILLALPPYSPPLLRKRAAWLKPFSMASSAQARYTRRQQQQPQQPSSLLKKRAMRPSELDSDLDSLDGGEDQEGKIKNVAGPMKTPLVSSNKVCFKSEKEALHKTASCLGRGVPVKGVSVRNKECWVCSCGKTEENGRTKSWAGQGCEKEDLSGDFVLLFFSAVGLAIVLLVSVTLLAGVGSEELPGTLASVGGGPGSKRD